MSKITIAALSRKAITDPTVTPFVDEVAAARKLEVARPLARGPVAAGAGPRHARLSVGQVALEGWFARLPTAKQRQVRQGVVGTVRATPALARKAHDLGVDFT